MPSPNGTNWALHPEYIELKNFVIEKTRNAKSPLSINQLAQEFKEKIGSSQTIQCLFMRIQTLREKATKSDEIDTATKVRMVFALCAPIDEDFLEKLRVDAHVELDEYNRITKYRAKDGSIELEGDHSQSAKKRMTSSDPISDREYIELMNFLIERTKDSNSPMDITQLAEEFKENSGSSQGISCLCGRIYKLRSEIHQWDSIDTATKVRLLFGLSVSVDEDFLKKLRMDAHVEVDRKNRITKYKANDESFELEGDHNQFAKRRMTRSSHLTYDREYIELIDFLIERTKDAKSPLSLRALAKEFKETSRSSQHYSCLRRRIDKFRSEIHQLVSIDTETKVKIMFALSTPIDEDFMKELRMDAHVEVDEKNRITKYGANDGSLELEGDHSQSAKTRIASNNQNYDQECIELIDFLIERTKDAKSSLNIRKLAEEFKEKSGSSQEVPCLAVRIYRFLPRIHQLDSIDSVTKVRMLLALSASVDEDFLEKLRMDAHVELDEYSRITKYKANDGSMELEGDHSQSAKRRMTSRNRYDDPEYIELINFLIEKTKDLKSPLNVSHLIEEFKEKSGSSQGISCSFHRIYKLRSEIQQLDSIDTETKVKILFGLSASVDEDFLEKLRVDAHVEVDRKSRITKYRAKDGSMELEGDHSQSAKKRIASNSLTYDREYIELMIFLVERTKDSKAPLKISRIAEEFKENSGSTQEIPCLVSRIYKFRSEIHRLGSIDTETKVRLLFGLSASIDEGFLKEIRMDAHVEVDGRNRITEYKAKDGRLELERYHRKSAKVEQAPRDPNYKREQVELMNFLIERTKYSRTPLLLTQLAEEFKEKSGVSQEISCLLHRIVKVCSRIHELDSIDRESKVKMLLALGAPVDEDFLNELRQDAHVEVDEKNRITKFIANDGSLELEGDHSQSAKVKKGWERIHALKSQNDSDDGSRNSTPKTPGSVKRAATEMSNSCKRAKDSSPSHSMKLENHAPNDSARIRESRVRKLVRRFSPNAPSSRVKQLFQPKKQIKMGSEKSQEDSIDGSMKRAAPKMPSSSKRAKDSFPVRFINLEDYDPEDSSRITESRAREPSNPGIQQIRQSKVEDALDAPIGTEPEADDGYASRMKFLKTIRSLVLNLDMPSLSPLQARIDKKLQESSSNEKIANEEMIMSIEVLVTKIANRSVLKLSENVESVSLKEFLCYLKAAILNSELEGLEGLLEKIKDRIKEPASKDKNIPVETVASALQYALDGFSF